MPDWISLTLYVGSVNCKLQFVEKTVTVTDVSFYDNKLSYCPFVYWQWELSNERLTIPVVILKKNHLN